MAQSDYPKIHCKNGVLGDIAEHRGQACLVKLKVKYIHEHDWIYHDMWIKPGWESGFIWQSAYEWMRRDQMYTKYSMSEIEEAQFYQFKLV